MTRKSAAKAILRYILFLPTARKGERSSHAAWSCLGHRRQAVAEIAHPSEVTSSSILSPQSVITRPTRKLSANEVASTKRAWPTGMDRSRPVHKATRETNDSTHKTTATTAFPSETMSYLPTASRRRHPMVPPYPSAKGIAFAAFGGTAPAAADLIDARHTARQTMQNST